MNKVRDEDWVEIQIESKTQEEGRMKEKGDIKLMYVSLRAVDVITSISRLAVNVEAKRQKASLTLTNRRTHFKHTKTGLAEAYTHIHTQA